MSYQPKTYRRFLASSVTAALVASAVVPVSSYVHAAAPTTFSDIVSGKTTGYDDILALTEQKIITGYPDGTFRPQEQISRAHVAVLLTRALQLEVPSNISIYLSAYEDVDSTHPYAKEIAAVTAANIFKGTQGKFQPSTNIRRDEMATVLVRSFQMQADTNNSTSLSDLNQIHPAHRQNVTVLAQHGITQGKINSKGERYFVGEASLTRAEFAAFLNRSLTATNKNNTLHTIDLIADGKVTINGKAFEIADSVAGIFQESNNTVLKNAKINVTTNNNKIIAVNELHLLTSGEANAPLHFNGNGNTLNGSLVVGADNLVVSNLTIKKDLRIGGENTTSFQAKEVKVDGKTYLSEPELKANFFQSLNITKQKTVFENSHLGALEITKENATIEVKGNSSVGEIVIATNTTFTASNTIEIPKIKIGKHAEKVEVNGKVAVIELNGEKPLQLTGTADIKQVNIQSKQAVELLTTGKIDKIETAEKQVQMTLGQNVKVGNIVLPQGMKAEDAVKNYEQIKQNVENISGARNPHFVPVPVAIGGGSGSSSTPAPPSNEQAPEAEETVALSSDDVQANSTTNTVVVTNVPANSTIKIYQAQTGGTLLKTVAAGEEALAELVITDVALSAGQTVYVSITEDGKRESTRVAVTAVPSHFEVVGTTALVGSAEALLYAATLEQVTLIELTDDISSDVTINRLVDLNFATFTLTGNLSVEASQFGMMSLEGTATYSIDGNISVDTPQATINNNLNISGDITVVDVGANSWNQNGNATGITIEDSDGGTFRYQAGTIPNGIDVNPKAENPAPILMEKKSGQDISEGGSSSFPNISVSRAGAKIDIAANVEIAEIAVNAPNVEIDNAGTIGQLRAAETVTNVIIGGKGPTTAPEAVQIVSRPGRAVVDPRPGTYYGPQTLSLTTPTTDAIIKYKINNGDEIVYNSSSKPVISDTATVTVWTEKDGATSRTDVLSYTIKELSAPTVRANGSYLEVNGIEPKATLQLQRKNGETVENIGSPVVLNTGSTYRFTINTPGEYQVKQMIHGLNKTSNSVLVERHAYELVLTGKQEPYESVADLTMNPVRGTSPEKLFGNLTPIKLRIGLAEEKNLPISEYVRILPVGNEHIQLWTQDSEGNWIDINRNGLGSQEGFAINTRSITDIYVLGVEGEHTVNLKLVSAQNPATVIATKTETFTFVFDRTKVDQVEAKINALPSINSLTLNDEDIVAAAELAYSQLTERERSLVRADLVEKLDQAAGLIGIMKLVWDEIEKYDYPKTRAIELQNLEVGQNVTNQFFQLKTGETKNEYIHITIRTDQGRNVPVGEPSEYLKVEDGKIVVQKLNNTSEDIQEQVHVIFEADNFRAGFHVSYTLKANNGRVEIQDPIQPEQPIVPAVGNTGISKRYLTESEVVNTDWPGEEVIRGGIVFGIDFSRLEGPIANATYFHFEIEENQLINPTVEVLTPLADSHLFEKSPTGVSTFHWGLDKNTIEAKKWFTIYFYDANRKPIGYYQVEVDIPVYEGGGASPVSPGVPDTPPAPEHQSPLVPFIASEGINLRYVTEEEIQISRPIFPYEIHGGFEITVVVDELDESVRDFTYWTFNRSMILKENPTVADLSSTHMNHWNKEDGQFMMRTIMSKEEIERYNVLVLTFYNEDRVPIGYHQRVLNVPIFEISAVQAVTAKIEALPRIEELELKDFDAVNEAKVAFHALTLEQQAQISTINQTKLQSAIQRMVELKAGVEFISFAYVMDGDNKVTVTFTKAKTDYQIAINHNTTTASVANTRVHDGKVELYLTQNQFPNAGDTISFTLTKTGAPAEETYKLKFNGGNWLLY